MRSALPISVFAVLAAAVALTPAAQAEPPWSDPQTVPGTTAPSALVVTGAGRALLATGQERQSIGGGGTAIVALGPDGAPGRVTALDRLADAHLVPYGKDRVVLAGRTLQSDGSLGPRSRVQVAFGTGGGDLGPLRGLLGSTGKQLFAMAGSARGDVALVTGTLRTRTLWVRRPTGGFHVVVRVTVGPRARDATVGVGPQGDVLFVWEDNHHIYSRHIGPSNGLGRTFRLGDGIQSRLQAAIDGTGRELVAWESQRVNEGEAATPATVFFATAAPSRRFGPARRVETVGAAGAGRYVAAPGVRLVVAADGATLLAWTGYDGSHHVTRAAAVESGHVRTAQTVSPAGVDAVLGDLAVGAGGRAVILSRPGARGADAVAGVPRLVGAAVRVAAGVPFGAPEAVSPAGLDVATAPLAALDPVTGRALAAFVAAPDTRVRIAQRAPVVG